VPSGRSADAHIDPFHDQTNGSWVLGASPYPTIMHSVGEAQETLNGPLPSVIALGVVNVVLVQVEPFHWSAIGTPLVT